MSADSNAVKQLDFKSRFPQMSVRYSSSVNPGKRNTTVCCKEKDKSNASGLLFLVVIIQHAF